MKFEDFKQKIVFLVKSKKNIQILMVLEIDIFILIDKSVHMVILAQFAGEIVKLDRCAAECFDRIIEYGFRIFRENDINGLEINFLYWSIHYFIDFKEYLLSIFN